MGERKLKKIDIIKTMIKKNRHRKGDIEKLINLLTA